MDPPPPRQHPLTTGRNAVDVTVSLVLVFSLIVGALLRFRAVGMGAAAACALFGFYLADTTAAENINETVTSLTDAISGIG
jgi:hypothetical protein